MINLANHLINRVTSGTMRLSKANELADRAESLTLESDTAHAILDELRAANQVGSPEWNEAHARAFRADNALADLKREAM